MASLQGKVALITGAGSGIGRATALLLARNGARVAVADISEKDGKDTVAMVKSAGGEAIFVRTDVARAADVQNAVDQTVRAFGAIHILHNNAGLMRPVASIEDAPEAEWDLVVDVSLKGTFLGTKAVYPIMKRQGGGVIINMSSVGALVPLGMGPAYGAAKAGVISFTRSLAQIGEKDNIRVNCICPSSVATHFRDAYPPDLRARMGSQDLKAEDVAQAVYYLATDDTVTGAALKVQLGKDRRVEYSRVASFDYRWEPVPGLQPIGMERPHPAERQKGATAS